MPKITHITASAYDIRLKSTLKWGKDQQLQHLTHVLVRAELSDGAVGIAEATPRPSIYDETQASILHIIDHHLAPMSLGHEVDDFESVARLCHNSALIKGNNTAKGAVDMALHHAVSRSYACTLADYLKTNQQKIRVSYIVSTGKPEDVIADVETAYGAGVRVYKVKIGKNIAEEIATIKQLIEQFPSAEFYVDANQCLTVDNGADILNELVELGVIHCEEALPVHQIKDRHKLRQMTTMPIIADDSAFTINDLKRELDFDTFDILNIKTARTGFSESREMLSLALEKQKGIMVGSQASSLLGCLYAATFAGITGIDYATECSFFLKTDADLSYAPEIIDGWIDVSNMQDSIDTMRQILA